MRRILFSAVFHRHRSAHAETAFPQGHQKLPFALTNREPSSFQSESMTTGLSRSCSIRDRPTRSSATRLSSVSRCNSVAKTSVLTSTGREWRVVVALNQTSIEDVRSSEKAARVGRTFDSSSTNIARGIEGIIGQDFLFAFNYTLDYRRKRLLWNDGNSSASDGIRVPLVAQGGRYLVRLTTAGTGPAVFLVPDSGASGFVAYERGGRTKLALTPALGSTAVHSLSGGQSVRRMMLRELRIGAADCEGPTDLGRSTRCG